MHQGIPEQHGDSNAYTFLEISDHMDPFVERPHLSSRLRENPFATVFIVSTLIRVRLARKQRSVNLVGAACMSKYY